MAQNRSVEAALLAWLRTFLLESKVESFADLSDGFVLSKILEDFDPTYAVNDLTESASPSKWINNKKSLEAVYKSLLRFTSRNCPELESPSLDTNIDFNAIAEHGDPQQMVKFLTIFLMAAVEGPNKQKYITTITSLDVSTQEKIATIIRQASHNSSDEPGTASAQTSAEYLALEEKHANLVSEHRKLKTRHETLITQHEQLIMGHESLKDDYTKVDSKRRALETLHQDGNQERAIKDLQARINENENLIATQENQLEDNRISKEKLEREVNSLRPNATRVRELDDEVKELKSQNDALEKKANMVDHYVRKLEASNNIEKDNKYLRSRIDTLEDNQKDYDTVYQISERRENTILEYEKKFAAYELEFTNVNSEFAILKSDSWQKDVEIETLKTRQAADEKFIQELQETISSSNNHAPHSPDSPGSVPRNLTLEDELAQAPNSTPNHLLEISRLQAENQLLRSGNAGTNNATLQLDLEDSERKCKRLAENLRDLTERQAITQRQLEAVLETSTHEKDNAISSTRDLERKATEELKATKAQLVDLQSQLTTQYRDLVAAQGDLAAIDQDELDALDDLKHTNEIITSSFKTDLQLLQTRHKNLIIDFDQQRAHLVESLLDRETLRKDLEVAKERIPEALPSLEGDAEEEKIKAPLSLKEQEAIIQDLQQRLQNAEEIGSATQKTANEAPMKALRRENSLIATAWYDLSSRLQSNHLVLQRRQDMPKSWLSKQRMMVNATPRR